MSWLRKTLVSLLTVGLTLGLFGHAKAADASIYFSPTAGQFAVGSTLSVSVVINTGTHSINAVEVGVTFPADKLQVISPSVGTSFISIWTTQPTYSNTAGTLSFSGGLPNPGIKSSAAVLSTIQFRVKSAGTATLNFANKTKILANDGVGTNVLSSKIQAVLTLNTAPPDGPVVVSSSHADSNQWYNDRTVNFSWEAPNGSTGYSYVFDNAAKTIPTEKVNETGTNAILTAETDGTWYFHIRAIADDTWGGTTHFLVRIDTTPPAQFTAKLNRPIISANQRALVSFVTTDAASGLDHYEIKVINTKENNAAVSLFHEESSPYQLTSLPNGEYKVIVRAYDTAGNYTDSTVDLTVGSGFLAFLGNLGTPAWLAIGIGLMLLLMLIIWRRHRRRDEESIPETAPQALPTQSRDPGQRFPTQQL